MTDPVIGRITTLSEFVNATPEHREAVGKAVVDAATIRQQAEMIENLKAERDAFYMEYRMICDQEIKQLKADLAHCEKHREQNRETAVAAIAERDAAQSLADHMTELWNEAERERDAALADVESLRNIIDGMLDVTSGLYDENLYFEMARAALAEVNPAMTAAIDEVTR